MVKVAYGRISMIISCLLLSGFGVLLLAGARPKTYENLHQFFIVHIVFFLAGAFVAYRFWENAKVVKGFVAGYAALLLLMAVMHDNFTQSLSDIAILLYILILLIPAIPLFLRLKGKSTQDRQTSCDTGVTAADNVLTAFINQNVAYYAQSFTRFDTAGGNFVFQWNWWSFFFPQAWFFYRKMYLAGIVAFVLLSVLNIIGWLIAGIVAGCCGNYIYYKHYHSKLFAIQGEDEKIRVARIVGGTNQLVAILVLVFSLIPIALALSFGSLFFFAG